MPFHIDTLLNRKHTCMQCGETFYDNSGTSKYCPTCAPAQKRARYLKIRYAKKKRTGRAKTS